jgi:hypothetical protein
MRCYGYKGALGAMLLRETQRKKHATRVMQSMVPLRRVGLFAATRADAIVTNGIVRDVHSVHGIVANSSHYWDPGYRCILLDRTLEWIADYDAFRFDCVGLSVKV